MKNHRRFHTIGTCLVLTALLASPPAATAAARELSPEELAAQLASFDHVWITVREKHPDPALGGIDWTAVRDELRPKIADAPSREAARELLREMLGRLGQSHFSIIPAEAYKLVEGPDGPTSRAGTTGAEVRTVDGHALVTSVRPGTPAADAGVRPGWEVVRAGGDEIAPLLATLDEELAGRSWRRTVLTDVVSRRLAGRVGESIVAVFRDGEDRLVELELGLVPRRGRPARYGHLPPVPVWIDAERLESGIGYIAWNAFLDPNHVMRTFNETMASFADAPGVVLDVRGNGGGIGAMAMGMLGWMVTEEKTLGTVIVRGHELEMIIPPRATTYDGPLVVLVDELSASAAEFLASGLQDLGRARIIGQATSGAVLGSTIERLPSGDGFQYVISDYISHRTGASLEGVGAQPDLLAPPERQALLSGRDPALEAAIAWILKPSDAP